jgi:hypothetical protein
LPNGSSEGEKVKTTKPEFGSHHTADGLTGNEGKNLSRAVRVHRQQLHPGYIRKLILTVRNL